MDLVNQIAWERLLNFRRRQPYESEMDYFRANPAVSGMATEDKNIILNPLSNLTPNQYQQVANNEALRLAMRGIKLTPAFEVTPQQWDMFKNTPYGQNIPEMKNTIIARYLTGDPSAGDLTNEQIEYARWLADYLFKGVK